MLGCHLCTRQQLIIWCDFDSIVPRAKMSTAFKKIKASINLKMSELCHMNKTAFFGYTEVHSYKVD